MVDRLLAALSIDMYNSLLLSVKKKMLKDSILFYILSLLLTVVHTFTLFLHIMALNVSINFNGYSLLALLVSNNIVEIRGAVWKKMMPENIFQIICADVVEMFELFIFVVLLSISNLGSYEWDVLSNPDIAISLVVSFACIMGGEILVDSIKHMFICKFNKIPLSTFTKSKFVLYNDLISTSDEPFKTPSLDSTTISARRLGVSQVPLSVLLICFVVKSITADAFYCILLAVVALLYIVKCVYTVTLRHIAYVFVARQYYESDDLVKSMRSIGRYLMDKGRIPA